MANYKGKNYSRTHSRTRARNKKTTQVLCVILAVLLFAAALIVIGVGSKGFKNWNLPTWFKKVEQTEPDEPTKDPEDPEDFDDNFIVDLGNGDLSLTSMKLSRAAAAASGVDVERVSSSVELTVRTTPSGADIVYWTMTAHFQDPESEWAEDKEVSDYIGITKPKYFKGRAIVSMKQAFGETIEIDVMVRDAKGKEVSTVVTCDYVKRVESATAYFSNYDSSSDIVSTLELDGYTKRYCVRPQITYGVGTITPTVSVDTLTMEISEYVLENMQEYEEQWKGGNSFIPSVKPLSFTYTSYFSLYGGDKSYTNFWGDDINTDELKEEYRHAFVIGMDKCYSNHFTAKVDCTLSYGDNYSDTLTIAIPNSCEKYTRLSFDYSRIVKSVDSVTVDQDVAF